MEIKDLKTLKKLIALCHSQGVQIIKVDGIELVLSEKKTPQKSAYKAPKLPETYVPGGITEDTKIHIEELTPEQLLFYSAGPNGDESQVS